MGVFKNISIIGTSHIAKQSVDEVAGAISNYGPDIIAVELDEDRAMALLTEQEGSVRWAHARNIGFKGVLFAKLGHWAENSLGKMVGMKPGSEMKHALQLANSKKIPVVFIDQPIAITLRRFSKKLTWREKARVIWDIFEGVWRSILRKPEFEFDMRKVPSKQLMKRMMDKVRERYPNIYLVLVTERNEYMAKMLFKLYAEYPDKKILAVMGAGHEDEVLELLKIKEKRSEVVHYSASYSVRV